MPIPDVIREAIAARTPRQTTIGAGRPWYGSVDPVTEYMGAVPEAYNPLEDFIPGSVLRRMATHAIGPIALGRIGVLPGRERIASGVIKRGLKEPWFHGSPHAEKILGPKDWGHSLLNALEEARIGRGSGFSQEMTGLTSGLRLGEPAGVSLTRSPEVARKFGDVLRVGVDIPPSSVGQFVDPEMQRLLREGYTKATTGALEKFNMNPAGFQQWLKQAQTGTGGVAVKDINQAMSDYLRNQGVEAIAYNPRRWAEYEMRVLDPNKAVPLGRLDVGLPGQVVGTPGPKGSIGSVQMNPAVPGSDVMQRYLYGYRGLPNVPPSLARSEGTGGLIERLRQQYLTAPEFPARLRDVLGFAGAD